MWEAQRIVKSDRIKGLPVKELSREKLLEEGPGRQADADLLAIVLRVCQGTFKKFQLWFSMRSAKAALSLRT
jgi:DNA repair protein RadC